jgi:site-specific DNA-cytosine methylase
MMENVPNMVAMKNGHFKSKILLAFAAAGYRRTAVAAAFGETGSPAPAPSRRRVTRVQNALEYQPDTSSSPIHLLRAPSPLSRSEQE